jgi:hypothetical protein
MIENESVSLTLPVKFHVFLFFISVVVDNNDSSFFFLLLYMCAPVHSIYVRVLFFESCVGKRDSPANGRLIKQDFIALVTVIENEIHTY